LKFSFTGKLSLIVLDIRKGKKETGVMRFWILQLSGDKNRNDLYTHFRVDTSFKGSGPYEEWCDTSLYTTGVDPHILFKTIHSRLNCPEKMGQGELLLQGRRRDIAPIRFKALKIPIHISTITKN